MSLNWDVTKCEDNEQLLTEEQWQTTQGMIFTTMGVGIGQLTEDTAAEFYARSHILDLLYGTPDEQQYTPETIKRYIGLNTNASFKVETRASWTKRVMSERLDRYSRVYRDSLNTKTRV